MCRSAVVALAFFVLSACAVSTPEPGPGEPVGWDRLDGWREDRHAEAWTALRRSCVRLGDRPPWREVCKRAARIEAPTDEEARVFLETHLRPHPVHGDDGRREGLVTGYYEPLLEGSREPGGRYRHPLYGPPGDLLRLELGDAYPAVAGESLRGRLDGRTVKPYPERAEIDGAAGLPGADALLWLDDPVDAFFLHVQGSGRVRLPDGEIVGVGFADHNGRPYRSIGRRLIEMGELKREEVDLFSIRRWLRAHPERARDLMHYNPRYVFFGVRSDASRSPAGSLNVPLTPGRSLAVDPGGIPLGAPVWLETSMPGRKQTPLNRLMLAQDTGAAIRGANRVDMFWGSGEAAERQAGMMKQPGRVFVLLPVRSGR